MHQLCDLCNKQIEQSTNSIKKQIPYVRTSDSSFCIVCLRKLSAGVTSGIISRRFDINTLSTSELRSLEKENNKLKSFARAYYATKDENLTKNSKKKENIVAILAIVVPALVYTLLLIVGVGHVWSTVLLFIFWGIGGWFAVNYNDRLKFQQLKRKAEDAGYIKNTQKEWSVELFEKDKKNN